MEDSKPDLSHIPLRPPPPGVASNLEDPPSIEGVATGILSTLIILQVFFLSIRLYVNIKSTKLMMDDGVAIAAFILSTSLAGCLFYLRDIAYDPWNIPVSVFTPSLFRVIYAQLLLLGPATFMGKAALLMTYYRFFSPNRSFRWKIHITIAFCFIISLAFMLVQAVLCAPAKHGTVPINPRCSEGITFGFVLSASGIIVDVVAFYLPIPEIFRLHMPLNQRMGILAIFATGATALIASGYSLKGRVYMYKTSPIGYGGYVTALCGYVEAAIGVICASMPAMAGFSRLHIIQNAFIKSTYSRCSKILSLGTRTGRKGTEATSEMNTKRSFSSVSDSNNGTQARPGTVRAGPTDFTESYYYAEAVSGGTVEKDIHELPSPTF